MQCPICGEPQHTLVQHFHPEADDMLFQALWSEKPGWTPEMGVCTRCLDQAQLDVQEQWGRNNPASGSRSAGLQVNGYSILPTPVRIGANRAYTGKGVTICLIDSGFCAHPDLVEPKSRIRKYLDIHQPGQAGIPVSNSSWHGTMTSVVCAGNGHLSGGRYASVAPDAELVLIKVTDDKGSISAEAITHALEWVLAHHLEYGIRIVNLSVTDDWPTSYRESRIDRAIERLVDAGVVVVAAAGNDQEASLKPPANSPHAITVGGLDDCNTLHPLCSALYHSTYGQTVDGLHKPDLVAPAIWIAAPILPGTPEQTEAALLFELLDTPDRYLNAKLANVLPRTGLSAALLQAGAETARQEILDYITHKKFVTPHYQHADGTSFAAPIVCSVIAQLLEARPALRPADIRDLLCSTARPLPHADAQRQGYGALHPAGALYRATGLLDETVDTFSPVVNYQQGKIEFILQEHAVQEAVATGDFTGWSGEEFQLQRNGKKTVWRRSIPLLPKGKYRYKYLLDGQNWQADTRNLFREPDGLGGFNSFFWVE